VRIPTAIAGFLGLTAAWAFQAGTAPPAPIIQDLSHPSQVLGGTRTSRVFLPPSYRTSQKRYPVIYWFHGYERGTDAGGWGAEDAASFVAAHEVIVVNVGPVDTVGEFPLYFPELVEQVDRALRAVADRDHRAVTGYSVGGFMALWMAAKYPDLVSSASGFAISPELSAGPNGFDLNYSFEDLSSNYEAVRTRLVTASDSAARLYDQRLNAIWSLTQPGHETGTFDPARPSAEVVKTLDFHMRAFARPLPKPAAFSHSDLYPNFAVWGWTVASNRRQPGYTVLENVSVAGFRSVVREWSPGGAVIPRVKLSIASARLYPPESVHTVTYIRLRDGKVRRTWPRADSQGRRSFELDGDAYEVGVSAGPLVAISGFEVTDAAWATAGRPVHLRVKFLNKGAVRSVISPLRWESPNPGVKLASPATRLLSLNLGETSTVSVMVTVSDPAQPLVRVVAVEGTHRLEVDVPLFPPAEPVKDFQIADGRTLTVWQDSTQPAELTLGEGNGDGFAAPGERFAVLLPDGAALRPAEVFTNDACVDTTVRASEKYSLPAIRPDCQPGHIVHLLASIRMPDYRLRYVSVEFPVWWRHPEDAPKEAGRP
jgi:pimeloyl-ACP methyl ester carboxylesterase